MIPLYLAWNIAGRLVSRTIHLVKSMHHGGSAYPPGFLTNCRSSVISLMAKEWP